MFLQIDNKNQKYHEILLFVLECNFSYTQTNYKTKLEQIEYSPDYEYTIRSLKTK